MRSFLLALCLLAGIFLTPANAACGDGSSQCWWIGTGNWNTSGNWSNTEGGASSGTTPATGDDICFSGTSNGNSTLNTSTSPKSVDFAGTCSGGTGGNYTGTLTHSASVNLTIGTAGKTGGAAKWNATMGYTLSNATSSAIIFDADGGTNAFTPAGKTFGNITVGNSNAGLTVQLQDSGVSNELLQGAGATLTLTRGTLDFNNQDLLIGNFASSNSNTRTLTPGSGTITVIGTAGSVFTTQTSTNFTLTTNTATWDFVATASASRNIVIGGNGGSSWGTISVTNASPDGKPIDFQNSASFTVANLTLTNVQFVRFMAGTTTTITTMTYTGTSSNPAVICANLTSSSSIGTLALTNTWSPQWMTFNGIARSAGTITATNSWNSGNNTTGANFTISAPSTGGSPAVIGG